MGEKRRGPCWMPRSYVALAKHPTDMRLRVMRATGRYRKATRGCATYGADDKCCKDFDTAPRAGPLVSYTDSD